ncbi:hypothetical protein FRC10_009498 [Ceratobasidium sp. 414]|nr:hypothetical protein FRC10_009498 [Ceratobasidium sp. 414]
MVHLIFTLSLLLVPLFVAGAPVPRVSKRAFQLREYADFQISSTPAGTAQAEAAAVFLEPFNGIDLKTVPSTDLSAMSTMRSAAESAEADFNSAIDAAGGTKTAEGAILQAGKIKNKVLKLTGLLQIDLIKKAQGATDVDDQIADIQTKLSANIKIDVASKGKQSKTFLTDSPASQSNTTATPVAAVAVPAPALASGNVSTAADFILQKYADFQISSTPAGNAQAEADAVFVDMFKGVDLNSIPSATLAAMSNMRSAAEDAEANFVSAIAAAGGQSTTKGAELQVGLIKNKVLKLTGLLQIDTIKKAQGATDQDAKIADIQTKLANNVKQDTANAGKTSLSFLSA